MTYIEGLRRMAKGPSETDLFGEPVHDGLTASEVAQIKVIQNRRHAPAEREPLIRPCRVVKESETVTWLLHD